MTLIRALSDFDREASQIVGKYIDYDGAPREQPYQCHDVWLWLLLRLGGQVGWGYAPTGWTVSVFDQFPYRNELTALFTKHGGTAGIQKGDVLFWEANAWFPGTHTAVATGPVMGELVPTLTQNPGPTKYANLITRGLVGYLRPNIFASNGSTTGDPDMAFESIRHPNGTIIFADEYGVEGIDAYRSADIGVTEYLETFSKVFGAWQQLSAREFDIASAIALRRRDAVESRIANLVVARMGGTSTEAIVKAVTDAINKQGVKVDVTALTADIAKAVNDDAAARMQK